MPARLEDRGAVAFEFALVFPVQLLLFAGIFGIGVAMIQKEQLNYVVQGAAQVEAAYGVVAGAGVTWASTQLPPPAAFLATTAPCGAQISGQWPISLGLLPSLTLSAQACSPIKPPTQPAPPTG